MRVFLHFTRMLFALLLALALAAGALAEAMPVPTDEPVYLDDDREALRSAQQRLIDLGFLKGGADGAFGPKTEAALRAYQSQAGLTPSGHLDADTLEALTHVDPNNATARDVQQRLIDLGYLEGVADGIIGPRSVDALKLFQRLQGLKADGKAGEATLEALFSDAAEALPPTLSAGSKSAEVEHLQARLIQFGFMEGEPDGSYGAATSAAVRAFQQHLIDQGYSDGITANGAATPLTQYCLFSDRYSTYLRDVPPGVADAEARRVERRLTQLGYMDLPADDILDDYGLEALKLFQNQCQAQPDGLADRETIDALFANDAPRADHCAPHAIASGDASLAVRAVEDALVCGGMMTGMPAGRYDAALEKAVGKLYDYLRAANDPKAELFADPKALSVEAQQALSDGLLGFRSDDMDDAAEALRVQSRLYSLYYLPREGVDGKFGGNSAAALRQFQADNQIFQTGTADMGTQNYLFSAAARAKPYAYRVEVSLERQKVDIYQRNDAGEYEQVQSFTCSTGLHDTTPRGIFLDAHPVNRWHHFTKFNCWAQYSYVIEGDIMFHSVLYSTNNENSLRSGSLYALGNPASHGCVRLAVADAKWLFENCKRGTAVVVIY